MIDRCAAEIVPTDPVLSDWVRRYALNHRHRLAGDLMIVADYVTRVPGARIVEFGTSPAILTLAMQRLGYDVTGLDLAPERLSDVAALKSLTIHKVDFETQRIPAADGAFDLALLNEVFEHMRINLIRTMTEVHRVIRPGGTLILSTPNLRSLRGLWNLLRHHVGVHVARSIFEEFEKLTLYGHMGHVREYTAHEVSTFLARVGFTTREIRFRSYGPPVRRALPIRALGATERAICTILPSWRPMFTLICEKT